MYDRYDLRRAGAVFVRILAAALLTGASACMGMYLRDRLRRRVRIWTQIGLFLREVRLRARLHEPLDAQIEGAKKDMQNILDHLKLAKRCFEGSVGGYANAEKNSWHRNEAEKSLPQGCSCL